MIPEGYKQDAHGALIPIDKIKPQDLLEDELVESLITEASVLNKELLSFKMTAFEQVQALRDLIAQHYNVFKGGKKGNLTLTSFDGRKQVQVAISDTLTFGKELEAAKALIDECVERWSEGANDNLKLLVNDAFQVNKQGRIDTQRVLSLRKLNIEDAEWKRAMDAISDALRVTATREYIRFYQINPETGVKTPIVLDIAGV